MEVNRLHPLFAAELIGADLSRAPDAALVALVGDLMREHGILVIRGQDHIGDGDHIRFSEAFGPLELPPGYEQRKEKPGRMAAELYDASNLDEDGEIAPADALRHKFAKGNEMFHADSSFNTRPTSWSLLLCHIPAPERGATEFVDGRAVCRALPDDMKARLAGMRAEHNFWVSRERGGLSQPEAFKAAAREPVLQPVIATAPNGEPTLYVGSHLYRFEGLGLEESEALLHQLIDFASQPRFIYAHPWRKGDLVIWDNRCTLHRATPFDYLNHKRDLRRTTISGIAPAGASVQVRESTVAV